MDTKEYIKYVKTHVCLVCGTTPVDPDHLEARGMGGAKKKGTVTNSLKDYSCVPLCRVHHSERHNSGNEKFERRRNINLWKEAFRLLRGFYCE